MTKLNITKLTLNGRSCFDYTTYTNYIGFNVQIADCTDVIEAEVAFKNRKIIDFRIKRWNELFEKISESDLIDQIKSELNPNKLKKLILRQASEAITRAIIPYHSMFDSTLVNNITAEITSFLDVKQIIES